MTHKGSSVAAFLMAALVFAGVGSVQTAAQTASDSAPKLAGKWMMSSTTPDGSSVDWGLEIKEQDGALVGFVFSGDSSAPAKDFKVDGIKVHLKTTYNDNDYLIDLSLDGDKLKGKWAGDSDSGATIGTRAPAAAATPSK